MRNITDEDQPLVRRVVLGDPLESDPFRLTHDLIADPFLLFQRDPIVRDATWNPSFEVRDTPEGLVITSELPGVQREDLDISVIGNQLHLIGARHHEDERSYEAFTRTFPIPETGGADRLRCDLTDGRLTIVVPAA
jgi:HSP20 family protein